MFLPRRCHEFGNALLSLSSFIVVDKYQGGHCYDCHVDVSYCIITRVDASCSAFGFCSYYLLDNGGFSCPYMTNSVPE